MTWHMLTTSKHKLPTTAYAHRKKYKSASIHSRNQSNKMQGRESIPAKSTAQNPTNQTEVKLGPLHLIHPNPKPISLNHPRYPPLTRPQHLPHHQVQVRGGGGGDNHHFPTAQKPQNSGNGGADRTTELEPNRTGPSNHGTARVPARGNGSRGRGGETAGG